MSSLQAEADAQARRGGVSNGVSSGVPNGVPNGVPSGVSNGYVNPQVAPNDVPMQARQPADRTSGYEPEAVLQSRVHSCAHGVLLLARCSPASR